MKNEYLKQIEEVFQEDLKKDIQTYALGIFVDRVLFGTYTMNGLCFTEDVSLEYLIELRVFNTEREYHLQVLENGNVVENVTADNGCIIIDLGQIKTGKVVEVLFDQHLELSSKVAYDEKYYVVNGKNKIMEDRGRKIELPDGIEDEEGVQLIVRNYIEYKEVVNGQKQSIITGSRLVGFSKE